MSESDKDNHKEEKIEGAFEIMEGLMAQLNSTKKMFLALILTIIVLPAIAMIIVVATFGISMDDFEAREGSDHGPPFGPGIIIFVAAIVWLGIGIRKWFVISKWGKKYEQFKQRQAELERKFDEEDKNQGN
ncbi:MAG: hypothetical protein ACR2LL_02775 [Nitrosopumilus sp.]